MPLKYVDEPLPVKYVGKLLYMEIDKLWQLWIVDWRGSRLVSLVATGTSHSRVSYFQMVHAPMLLVTGLDVHDLLCQNLQCDNICVNNFSGQFSPSDHQLLKNLNICFCAKRAYKLWRHCRSGIRTEWRIFWFMWCIVEHQAGSDVQFLLKHLKIWRWRKDMINQSVENQKIALCDIFFFFATYKTELFWRTVISQKQACLVSVKFICERSVISGILAVCRVKFVKGISSY